MRSEVSSPIFQRKSSRIRLCLSAAFIAAILVFLPAGCGGGGHSFTPAATPTAYPEACSDTAYLPNYSGGDGKTPMILSRWQNFPVRVYFDTTSEDYTSSLQARAVTAFDGWVTQTGSKVQYTLVSNAGLADIVVRFVSTGNTILTTDNAVGITYTEDLSGTEVDGRPYLASANVYIGIDGDVSRENGTMAHEFGHSLGIGGHSPNPVDLMYYAGSSRRSLIPTTSDVNTLRTAYCDSFPVSTAESRAVVPMSKRVNRRAIQ